MNIYPRLGHQMAALVGSWMGSPLMGMQVLTVMAMACVWAGLFWLVASLPWRVASVAAACIGTLLLVNHFYLGIPLHGDEVVRNFFYPQLLGQSMVVAMLLVSIYLERRGIANSLRYLLLIPPIYLLVGLHLLPALILLTLMGWMVVIDWLVHWRSRQPKLLTRGLTGIALVACALLVLVSHPSFATMREISRNNGGVDSSNFTSAAVLPWFSIAVSAVAVLLLCYWQRRRSDDAYLPLKFIAMYCLAVSTLALAQCLSLVFGFASDYALRKYAYALDTAALLELGVVTGILICRQQRKDAAHGWLAALSYCILPALLTTIAFLAVAWRPPRFHTSELVAVEYSLQAIKKNIGSPQPGKADYLLGLGNFPAVIEYMYSIATLYTPRAENPNAASLLFHHRIDNWTSVAHLITAENSPYDTPACRTGQVEHGLVVLAGDCLTRHGTASPYIDFTDVNKFMVCATSGLSGQEPGGSWTAEREVILRCPRIKVGGRLPQYLDLIAVAFRGDVRPQRVVLEVDGRKQQPAVYGGAQHQAITVPLLDTDTPEVELKLILPDAVSPRQLGLGADDRKLGLYLKGIAFRN